jgi:restriction system protein
MTPDDYERLVEKVYEDLLKQDGIRVFHLKEYIRRSSGLPIKIDVSFEMDAAGARILVAIECKHYGREVDVGAVDEFFAKLQDIGAHKGIIVTTVGFQPGAESAAEGRGIALALLTDATISGELVYLRKRRETERADILRGNIRLWGRLSDKKNGVRFDSARDLTQGLMESIAGE